MTDNQQVKERILEIVNAREVIKSTLLSAILANEFNMGPAKVKESIDKLIDDGDITEISYIIKLNTGKIISSILMPKGSILIDKG